MFFFPSDITLPTAVQFSSTETFGLGSSTETFGLGSSLLGGVPRGAAEA